jgi:hypothetical protein
MALGAGAAPLSGCGASDHDQVQAKVEQFLHATATKDYRTLCNQVLAPSLLERLAAGGIPCEQAMQIGLGGVQGPILSIGRILVNGQRASAITLTGARGQRGSIDAIELIKTGQGWRVTSLESPLTALGRSSRRK